MSDPKPSITFWNRLEPRARSADLANALAARVRDPAWFLSRQWQMGEFQGEDAGTPAYVRVQASVGPIVGWSPANQSVRALPPDVPIERAATSEPFAIHDVSLAVEIGQSLDRLLGDAGQAGTRGSFLKAFPIGAGSDDDPRSARLRTLWHGRAIDGVAVYLAALKPPVAGAPPPGVPPDLLPIAWPPAKAIVDQLVAWVKEVYGALGPEDPAAWQAERLDYAVHAHAASPTGGMVSLTADPGRDGELDWYSFDSLDKPPPAGAPTASAQTIQRAVIPGHVKFRGMPNERFWDFEDGRVDFAGMTPDRRSLGAMVLMDFMLVQGNDWFLVPFEQPVGTVAGTTLLQVVDVFGVRTDVPRADAPVAGQPRWTMFSARRPDGDGAGYLVLPASAAATLQDGPVLEDVRFLRDEMANLVWGVERATEGNLGAAWLGSERVPAGEELPPASGLRYRVQTSVPQNWIPFQPVAISAGGEIALECAALLVAGATQDTPPVLPAPHGKVLAPQTLPPDQRYRVREEEVPREGTRVTRVVRLARSVDGSSHLWIARKRSVGGGEGWSGLRFDVVEDG